MSVETCANCGEKVGKLEAAYLWREQVVCAACHARLASPVPPLVPTYEPKGRPTPAPPAPASATPQLDDEALYRIVDHKLAIEDRLAAERGSTFSIIRVLGMLILLAGIPLTCFLLPAGVAVMILGAVMVIAGK